MENFPTLETDRLLLTNLQAADIPRIVEYASDKEISQFTLNIPHPYSEKDAISWIGNSHRGFEDGLQLIFAMRHKSDPAFIGGIGLTMSPSYHRAEMGYWVAKPCWGRGYASEALGVIINYGFQKLGLNKLFATHLDKNTASGKVMEKNGMTREGVMKEHIFKDGAYYDLVQYGITKSGYPPKVGQQSSVR